jgi:hypothetical protein
MGSHVGDAVLYIVPRFEVDCAAHRAKFLIEPFFNKFGDLMGAGQIVRIHDQVHVDKNLLT